MKTVPSEYTLLMNTKCLSRSTPVVEGTVKKKIYFFRIFFINIIVEPECSEMDNFDKKKIVCDRPPYTCIQNDI